MAYPQFTTFIKEHSTDYLVNTKYDKKKLKERSEQKNKFSEDEISRLIGLFEAKQKQTQNTEMLVEDETNLIRGIFHEVRRLSREINSQRAELLKNSGKVEEKITALVDNIYATSQLISIRIDSYELYKNPTAITSAIQPRITVYKKFDKARFIINAQSNNRNINIKFSGESHFTLDGYEIFDLLPYILLDNAVKYTRRGMEINVDFNDSERTVVIKNIRPKVPKEQLEQIFQRGVRGKYSWGIDGNGLGLFMAKEIADLHKIKCYAESSDEISYSIDSVPYSEFKIVLDFKNKLW